MPENIYLNYLKNVIRLSKNDRALLTQHLEIISLKKGEFLSMPNQSNYRLGYLIEGVARIYRKDENGNEHICCFCENHYHFGDFASFFSGRATDCYVQAVTDIDGVCLSLESITYLQRAIPSFTHYMNQAFNQHLLDSIRLQKDFIVQNTPRALKTFKEKQPFASRYGVVSDIASFLGTSEKTLKLVIDGDTN